MIKFKKNAKVVQLTDDFWYSLTDGGYIKPEKLLEEKGAIKEIQSAIETILLFQKALEDAELIEYN